MKDINLKSSESGLSLLELIISMLISGIMLSIFSLSISSKGRFYNNFLNKNKLFLKEKSLESSFRAAKSSSDNLYFFENIILNNQELVFFSLDLKKIYLNSSKKLKACPKNLSFQKTNHKIKAYLVFTLDGVYAAELSRANKRRCLEGSLSILKEASSLLTNSSDLDLIEREAPRLLVPLKNIYSFSINKKGKLIKRHLISNSKQTLMEGLEKLEFQHFRNDTKSFAKIKYQVTGLPPKKFSLSLPEKKGSMLDVIF